MPDLRELRIFVAVGSHPSFTAAGRSLGITQQSVSRVIADLEEQLGVVLVVRTTRATSLTAAGELLLRRAREMLKLQDRLAMEVRSMGVGDDGAIRLGLTHEVGEADRSAVTTAVSTALPGARVSIHEISDSEVDRALNAGEIDLALLVPNGGRRLDMQSAELRPTRMSAYVLDKHPLAATPRVRLADFSGDSLMICRAPGEPYIDRQISAFLDAGIPVNLVRGRINGSMTQALSRLAELDAIALLPADTRTPDGVTEVAVPGLVFPLTLVWANGLSSSAVDAVRHRLSAR